jgi:hypothetical protein
MGASVLVLDGYEVGASNALAEPVSGGIDPVKQFRLVSLGHGLN